jgi:HPt (histidine-containing phosphotransfer) domain-containing protein
MGQQLNPVLDAEYIDQAYGDDSVILYMIFDAFLGDSMPRWKALHNALLTEDKKESASIVHGLKPSFTMTGLTKIRTKVDELERAIKNDAETAVLLDMYLQISGDLEIAVPILEEESERLKQL